MAVSIRGQSFLKQVLYYIQGQAATPGEYFLQGLATFCFGWIPGPLGIALRGLVYRLVLQMSGFAVIEPHVRIRHGRGVRLGSRVYIDQGVYLHACPQGIDIGNDTCVMHNAELHVFNFRDLPHAFIRIGHGTFVGESVVVRGQGGVTIGNNVLIGPLAKILAVNHEFADISRPVIDQGISGKGIVIEDGSWIGAGAAVLDGVRVGRGAVVGANAVVTRDVPAHSVVAGSPARVIKVLDGGEIGLAKSNHSGRGDSVVREVVK